MIDKILGKKAVRKKPVKTVKKTVPAKQYNELVSYYTKELETLRAEMERLREQNTLIMKTAMKQGERVKELEERNQKLSAENQRLQLDKE